MSKSCDRCVAFIQIKLRIPFRPYLDSLSTRFQQLIHHIY